MEASDIAAIATAYASVVATAALALEIRRWFETGPRLKLTVIPRSRLVGGVTEDKNVYLTARITNTGNLPTTILNFALLEYKSYLNKIWGRACNSAIVPNPASGGEDAPLRSSTGNRMDRVYVLRCRFRAMGGNWSIVCRNLSFA